MEEIRFYHILPKMSLMLLDRIIVALRDLQMSTPAKFAPPPRAGARILTMGEALLRFAPIDAAPPPSPVPTPLSPLPPPCPFRIPSALASRRALLTPSLS